MEVFTIGFSKELVKQHYYIFLELVNNNHKSQQAGECLKEKKKRVVNIVQMHVNRCVPIKELLQYDSLRRRYIVNATSWALPHS